MILMQILSKSAKNRKLMKFKMIKYLVKGADILNI